MHYQRFSGVYEFLENKNWDFVRKYCINLICNEYSLLYESFISANHIYPTNQFFYNSFGAKWRGVFPGATSSLRQAEIISVITVKSFIMRLVAACFLQFSVHNHHHLSEPSRGRHEQCPRDLRDLRKGAGALYPVGAGLGTGGGRRIHYYTHR